ncbi:BTB/POZ domain-containing protein 6-B-like [Dendronephthya gigantea]|uniref:BTB/POZ domain-containing protein 6-B-like n=1 Tax=Dendronephthya gigantea TaxID=151771 RepID=UPI00106D3443|nr:BTB/POZ domain-containing protein 6-B-like [Dendronephthya gigantea]
MASKYHDDWQSSKTTVLQRNAFMFDNELMSDVSFVCGETSHRVFHAHKYVLATSSAAFFAMFYGDLAQKESPIRIKDADEQSFKEFLRFLYVDDCEITAENAIGIMNLAKKYLIPSLADKCCKVLETSIKPDNVFTVLEGAKHFDESDLEAKCWAIVSRKTLDCVNSEAFCTIGSHTLDTLLKTGTLGIEEVDLFIAVLKWVDSECKRQGIQGDAMARRRVLGDSVNEIRFLEMSQEDFANYVPATGILTDTEIVSIFCEFNGVVMADSKWKSLRRRRSAFTVVGFSRFNLEDLAMPTTDSWSYKGNPDALIFSVKKKAVSFHGVRLFGNADSGKYEVTFTIKDKTVTGTYNSEQDDDGVWGYDVMLSKAMSLLPDEDVTIIATIKGPRSYFGTSGKSYVKSDEINVTYKKALSGGGTYGTSVNRGQFYKIFLSLL